MDANALASFVAILTPIVQSSKHATIESHELLYPKTGLEANEVHM